MQVSSHYTLLIYPFRHAMSLHERATRLAALEPRWCPWWARFNEEGLTDVLDDTHFFLPYVRRLLFPETVDLPEGPADRQVKAAQQTATQPIARLAERLIEDGVLRFTLREEQVLPIRDVRLESKHPKDSSKDLSFPAVIDWIDVALFPQQVGFLVIKVLMTRPETEVPMLAKFLSYAKLIHPPYVGAPVATWTSVRSTQPLSFKSLDLVDYLVQGMTGSSLFLDQTFHDFLERARAESRTHRYSSTEVGQVYGQVFREFTYAALVPYPDGSVTSAGEHGTADTKPMNSVITGTRLFSSAEEQALYSLATASQPNDPTFEPHPRQVRELLDHGHIALWSNWQGLALHDNVVFLARQSGGFSALQYNVESDYFHLYLLALYQKIRLSWLAGEAMRHGANLHHNADEARNLWDAFTRFRNHFWFAEVTFKPQGIELYKRYHTGLQVATLYNCINDEVRQLQEYYERKSEHRIESLLNFIALVALPIEVVVHLFAHKLGEEGTELQMLQWALLGIFFMIALYVIWIRYFSELKLTLWAKNRWRKLSSR